MVYGISAHKLTHFEKGVPYVASPNRGGALAQRLYLIIHYTAGAKADGAIDWFRKPEAKASAHLVIDRNGDTTQMVEFNRVAWHAGRSSWHELTGMNAHSIGIEIANAGKLSKGGDGKWRSWSGTVIDAADVIVATHKHETHEAGWHRYRHDQVQAVVDIGIALRTRYKFIDVLGHEDISPVRKVDPGPAFPTLSVAGKIMVATTDAGERRGQAAILTAPASKCITIAPSPASA